MTPSAFAVENHPAAFALSQAARARRPLLAAITLCCVGVAMAVVGGCFFVGSMVVLFDHVTGAQINGTISAPPLNSDQKLFVHLLYILGGAGEGIAAIFLGLGGWRLVRLMNDGSAG